MRLDLGPVTLDTDRHQVFRDGKPAHLSTKAFQLLELLVESRPRALSKDELQKALWPDTFVSDTSLTTLVNELRTLLSETARKPRFIRTVHGFGYAFEGEARPAPPLGLPPGLGSPRHAVSRRERTSSGAIPEPAGPFRTRRSPDGMRGSRSARASPPSRTSTARTEPSSVRCASPRRRFSPTETRFGWAS